MSEKDLENKLDLLLHNQKSSAIFTQMLFGWTGILAGYIIGLVAPTAFVLVVSNIIIIFSSWLFMWSLIRFIRSKRQT